MHQKKGNKEEDEGEERKGEKQKDEVVEKEKGKKGKEEKEGKSGKKDKKNIICSFYVKKKCIYGKRCRFLHEKPAHELDSSAINDAKKEREGRSKVKKKDTSKKSTSVDREKDGQRSKFSTLSERSSSVSSISSVESGNEQDLSMEGGSSSQKYRTPYVARDKDVLEQEAQRVKENVKSVPGQMREVQDTATIQKCQDLKERLLEMVRRNNEVMNIVMGELNQ